MKSFAIFIFLIIAVFSVPFLSVEMYNFFFKILMESSGGDSLFSSILSILYVVISFVMVFITFFISFDAESE